MITEEIESNVEHTITISYVDDDAFEEDDEIVLTLKSDAITKIVVVSKNSSSIEFDNKEKPIEPSSSIPSKPNSRNHAMVWVLPTNNRGIKRIARYGCSKNKYVYTFHWEKTSITSKKVFFKSLWKFFWGGLSGKSGSGGGLTK